jgi:putative nucleotidyltransferase with HDIG domain
VNSYNRKLLESAVQKLQQLPTLPVVYQKLQEVMDYQRVSAQQVGMVIEQDQSLASKILKVVNSAYYGFPRRISTISQAVVILGFNEIKHLALSISIIHTMGNNDNATIFNYLNFWRHCIGVAICSGVLSRKIGVTKGCSHEEAFVAGLLHDIGKLVMEQYLHENFLESLRLCNLKNVHFYDAEKMANGFTHEETGEYLLEYWKLPQTLVTAAGFHHSPDSKSKSFPSYSVVSIVHIADVISHAIGLGNGGDLFVPPLNQSCWEFTGLSTDSLESIIAEVVRSYEDVSKYLLG